MAKRDRAVTKQALLKHVLTDGMVTELLPFGLGGAGESGIPRRGSQPSGEESHTDN